MCIVLVLILMFCIWRYLQCKEGVMTLFWFAKNRKVNSSSGVALLWGAQVQRPTVHVWVPCGYVTMISGFLDCLKDCSVCVVFVCTSCVLGATRVQWAGREPRRYRGRDLQYLQSTNACGHLVDVSFVRRVELLGIRRTGQRREGRRCRCGCPSGLAALQSATAIRPTTTTTTDSVPRLLGHSSIAFVSSCSSTNFSFNSSYCEWSQQVSWLSAFVTCLWAW